MSRQPIPRRTLEDIAAEAIKRYGDPGYDEKIPTTTISNLVVDRVSVTSRYQKAHELELMQDVLLALPDLLRREIASIDCDSQATFTFSVILRGSNRNTAGKVGTALHENLMQQNGGHNGIYLGDVFINPDWNDDDRWNDDEWPEYDEFAAIGPVKIMPTEQGGT